METKVRYTIVGLFIIVLTAAMIFIGLWIGLRGQIKEYNTYVVNMQESVSCLGINSVVKFNGVTVGVVSDISLNAKDPRIVHLILKIEKSTPITTATTAVLEYQGLTGICLVEMKTKSIGASPLKPKPGEPYPTIPWSPSIAVRLDEILNNLSTNLNNITEAVTKLLSPENQKAINKSLENIAQFTDMLKTNKEDFARMIENTKKAMSNFGTASQKFGSASGAAGTTIETISQQTLPTTQDVLSRFSEVLNNLQQLTNQIQNNPSLLIRGRQTPPLGPGEK